MNRPSVDGRLVLLSGVVLGLIERGTRTWALTLFYVKATTSVDQLP